MELSALRLVGVVLSLGSILLLVWRRRSGRLLLRREVLGFVASVLVLAVAIAPSLADVLVRATGFQGDLSRVVSLLAFTSLGLVLWAAQSQARLEETRARLLGWMREATAERVEKVPVDILCVLPALNEADNLPAVLRQAPAEIEGFSVRCLIVDDGSDDGTAEVAVANGALAVRTPINVGGGHALQIGFAAAARLGARWVVTLDADGQHRFSDLPTLMAPLLRGEADVVVGSRQLGESIGHEATRAIGLRVFNLILSVLTGRRLTDCSSGYRAFELKSLRTLRLVQDRHHTAELLIEASRRGLRVAEVPITIAPRLSGESKKGTNLWYGLRFAKTVWSSWW